MNAFDSLKKRVEDLENHIYEHHGVVLGQGYNLPESAKKECVTGIAFKRCDKCGIPLFQLRCPECNPQPPKEPCVDTDGSRSKHSYDKDGFCNYCGNKATPKVCKCGALESIHPTQTGCTKPKVEGLAIYLDGKKLNMCGTDNEWFLDENGKWHHLSVQRLEE